MLAACSLAGYADEGMWMLTDLKKQNAAVMQDLGLDISIDKVYCPDSISLKDAVVHFGGGCTGEVISAEGLVLTNHHCGYQQSDQCSDLSDQDGYIKYEDSLVPHTIHIIEQQNAHEENSGKCRQFYHRHQMRQSKKCQ